MEKPKKSDEGQKLLTLDKILSGNHLAKPNDTEKPLETDDLSESADSLREVFSADQADELSNLLSGDQQSAHFLGVRPLEPVDTGEIRECF